MRALVVAILLGLSACGDSRPETPENRDQTTSLRSVEEIEAEMAETTIKTKNSEGRKSTEQLTAENEALIKEGREAIDWVELNPVR